MKDGLLRLIGASHAQRSDFERGVTGFVRLFLLVALGIIFCAVLLTVIGLLTGAGWPTPERVQ